MNVAIVGASPNHERYSYKALKSLEDAGHSVFLVSPSYQEIEGHLVFTHLADLKTNIHTVTMYVSADKSDLMAQEILKLSPKRVIFNPGAENPSLTKTLSSHGIECLNACTLVMLTVGNF